MLPAPGMDVALCGPGGGDGTGIITVRLLLSIDRREGACGIAFAISAIPPCDTALLRLSDGGAALETVELAHELRHRGVAGIDLSGNPSVGAWPTWLPALQAARDLGLAVTLHCGEVDNAEEVRLVCVR